MLYGTAKIVLDGVSKRSTLELLLLGLVAFSGVCLLLWRLWAFTIVPLLRPDEPRDLPYWIPC